jgi:hypothetical protein
MLLPADTAMRPAYSSLSRRQSLLTHGEISFPIFVIMCVVAGEERTTMTRIAAGFGVQQLR